MDLPKCLLIIVLMIVIVVAIYVIWVDPIFTIPEHMTSAEGAGRYRVTFRTEWGKEGAIVGAEFPRPPLEPPHTGNMLLVIHDGEYSPFHVGDLATKGVSESAMFGTNDTLLDEVKASGHYADYQTGPVLMAPGQRTFTVTADGRNRYLSFVTMIAPSSNWFTGVSGLDLRAITTPQTIPLYPHDAGTDYGKEFVTFPKHPRGEDSVPISVLANGALFPIGIITHDVPPIAYLEIEPLT